MTLPSTLRHIVSALLAPLRRSPRFFIALALMGAITAVSYALWIGPAPKLMLFAIAKSVTATWLLCLIPFVYRHRWVKWTVFSLLSLVALCDVASCVLINRGLSDDIINLVLESNKREATEFMSHYISAGKCVAFVVIMCVPGIVALVAPRLRFRGAKWVVAPVMAVLLGVGAWKWAVEATLLSVHDSDELLEWEVLDGEHSMWLNRRAQMSSGDLLGRVLWLAKSRCLYNSDVKHWAKVQDEIFNRSDLHQSAQQDDSLTVVLVIGESFIKAHSSLYGYYLPTSPRMEQMVRDSSLVAFTDVVSTATQTAPSLRNTLNLNSLSGEKKSSWQSSVFWPMLFKISGSNVYFYCNQSTPIQFNEGLGSMYFSPLMLNEIYSGYSTEIRPYDGDFLNYAKRELIPHEEGARKLVMWHLMGQHIVRDERIPAGSPSRRFSADDIRVEQPWLNRERRQEIADHDNATLYGDSVVSAIFNLYADENAVAVFFSDHGEELWDVLNSGGREMLHPENPQWVETLHAVPLLVWMSPKFRAKNPETAELIRAASSRRLMLDNLGQMMLRLGNIETEFYDPRRDFISPQWKPSPRITANGFNVDSLRP